MANLLIAPRPAAGAAGLNGYLAVNLRLKLVCEIVSPSNAATDRVLTEPDAPHASFADGHYYAEARIPYYLLVEQAPTRLSLFRLDGEHYVPQAKADAGTVLRIEDPVRVQLDPAMLG